MKMMKAVVPTVTKINFRNCLKSLHGGSGGGSSSPDFDPDFADPIDPDPPADPNDPNESETGDPEDPDDPDDHTTTTSCSASMVTDFWVSCATSGTSSTSCTTTSSMIEVGCDITAVTSTTGVPVCYSLDPYEDQGQDGALGAMSTVSLTPVTSPGHLPQLQPLLNIRQVQRKVLPPQHSAPQGYPTVRTLS
ncbi:class V chitinase [Penicillium chermesinum]|nr:class V chitinase [Penicillium chermesinum]